MSWLPKQSSPGNPISRDSLVFPLELELVPGFLSAEIHLNNFHLGNEEILCWSYLSKGLEAFGQKEILLSIQLSAGQSSGDFPEPPLDFFKTAFQKVLAGSFVDYGSISTFDSAGFISGRFLALGYIPAQNLGNWQAPANCMAGILLTKEELEAAKLSGLTRIVALMGKAYSSFPCSSWNNLQRNSLVSDKMLEDMKASSLQEFSRMIVRASSVTCTNNSFELVLPAHAKEYFADEETLESSLPLCLFTDFSQTADAMLVWEGNLEKPFVIKEGACISGTFICFMPDQAEDKGLILEDGFLLLLKKASWLDLRKALTSGRNFQITNKATSFNFKLIWTEYISPTSRNQINPNETADECSVEPHEHEDEAKTYVSAYATQIRYPELKTQLLNSFIEHIEDLVRDHFFCLGEQEGFDLFLDCTIQQKRVALFQIQSNPLMDAEETQDLLDRLSLSYAPEINENSINFGIDFAIWGGRIK